DGGDNGRRGGGWVYFPVELQLGQPAPQLPQVPDVLPVAVEVQADEVTAVGTEGRVPDVFLAGRGELRDQGAVGDARELGPAVELPDCDVAAVRADVEISHGTDVAHELAIGHRPEGEPGLVAGVQDQVLAVRRETSGGENPLARGVQELARGRFPDPESFRAVAKG